MAIATYSDLQQSIANFINRDDLTTYIPDFIALAEADMASDIESNELHVPTTLSVTGATVALPNNFKGMIRIKLNGNYPPLDYISPDDFYSRYASNTTGRPIAYTIEGNNIIFAPEPDDTYTAAYTYIGKPDIATDLTNRLLTIAPGVYLYGSLVQAAVFIDDESVTTYAAMYQTGIQKLNENDQNKGTLKYLSDVP